MPLISKCLKRLSSLEVCDDVGSNKEEINKDIVVYINLDLIFVSYFTNLGLIYRRYRN